MVTYKLDWQFVEISVVVVPPANLHTRWAEEVRKVLKKLLYRCEGAMKMH